MKKMIIFAISVVHLFSWGQESMILHVTTSNGGFLTHVVLRNDFGAMLPYRLIAFDKDGDVLTEVEGMLDPLQSEILDSQDLFGVEGVSHFAKSDDTLVSVGASYQGVEEGSGVANVLETSERATRWIIYPGIPNLSWDGLAILNRGTEAVPITVSQLDQQHDILKTVEIHSGLEPSGKALYVLATDFDLSHENTQFQIRADQPISVIALRGTPDNTVLWQNLALPLPGEN